MSWLALIIVFVVAIGVGALVLGFGRGRLSVDDLGTVSDHWIAHHRAQQE
jgi:hypothetical protein